MAAESNSSAEAHEYREQVIQESLRANVFTGESHAILFAEGLALRAELRRDGLEERGMRFAPIFPREQWPELPPYIPPGDPLPRPYTEEGIPPYGRERGIRPRKHHRKWCFRAPGPFVAFNSP